MNDLVTVSKYEIVLMFRRGWNAKQIARYIKGPNGFKTVTEARKYAQAVICENIMQTRRI